MPTKLSITWVYFNEKLSIFCGFITRFWQKLAKFAKYSAKVIRESGHLNLLGKIKKTSITKLLYKSYNNKNRPVLDSDSRLELIDIFKLDVSNLSLMLKTDLSKWLS